MLQISKNTYPKDGIGKYAVGTLCNWRIEQGHLLLTVCNETGTYKRKDNLIYEDIFTKGKIYALNGNLLTGKKEPHKIGIVAKYVKNGWFLELEFYNS